MITIGETVTPLFEEQLAVTRQMVPTAVCRFSRDHSREEMAGRIDFREKVEVKTGAFGQPVANNAAVREEGD